MKALIVGGGKLGYELSKHMILEDIDVTLMDTNQDVLERINEHIDILTIVANGIDMNALKEIDINTYDLLVASTSSGETNTLICALAKKLGCKKTIARVRNPEYVEQLAFMKGELGIDEIINPDLATARAIEKYLLKSYIFHSDEFASGKVEMIDFNIGYHREFVGKKLMDLSGFDSVLITAISREGKIIIPHGNTKLESNDTIHIIGRNVDIDKFSKKHNFGRNAKEVKDVMILGGGNIAYYLAKELRKSKISVRIIEQDKLRAQELSDLLDNVLIIHGDGTDINLLEEEMLGHMDAFVGTTGFDEQNLLMALMAKQLGVNKCIAKISRPNYTNIIDRLGVDAALNPVSITASNILKFIRGGKIASVSLLLGGDAEVIEMVMEEDSFIFNKPLSHIDLPRGIIIGAIVRNGNVIIPKGDSVIKARDRIVVFCLTENLSALKMFFNPRKEGLLSELWNYRKSSRNDFNN